MKNGSYNPLGKYKLSFCLRAILVGLCILQWMGSHAQKDSTTDKFGFKSLFRNKFDASKPYAAQLNPRAVSFVQEYMRKHTKSLEKMKLWGKPYFDLYDGEEDLKSKFMEVTNDDNLSVEEKSNEIAAYLDEKWGLYDGYMDVVDYLESLFMDEDEEDSEYDEN
jgi:hypothetical protein